MLGKRVAENGDFVRRSIGYISEGNGAGHTQRVIVELVYLGAGPEDGPPSLLGPVGRSKTMKRCQAPRSLPSLTTDLTFSINTGLAASTVTPGIAAPETSRMVPVMMLCAYAVDATIVNTETLKDNSELGKALTGAWFETIGEIEFSVIPGGDKSTFSTAFDFNLWPTLKRNGNGYGLSYFAFSASGVTTTSPFFTEPPGLASLTVPTITSPIPA